MIFIASRLFDLLGHLTIDPLPSGGEGSYTRRVNRSATLDADPGVVINDRGYVAGDRTLTYRWKPVSREHDERAKRLLRLHPQVTVSCDDGVYLAAPQELDLSPDENTFTFLPIRKLSED